jgi:hypothetical protein
VNDIGIATASAFFWDDVNYDDGTGDDPAGHPGVIGGNGFHALHPEFEDSQAIVQYWALPANSGKVGDAYFLAATNPSTTAVTPY